MNNRNASLSRLMSPEWVVAARTDFSVNEALAGGWDVSPTPLARGASFTDFSSHEIGVPDGDSPSAVAVRLHELIHASVSPTSVPMELLNQIGVSMRATRLAEEMRVNFLGRRASAIHDRMTGDDGTLGNTLYLSDGSEVGVADRCVATNNWQDALSLYLTTYNTEVHRAVKRRLRRNPDWKEPLDVVNQRLGQNDYDYSKGVYGGVFSLRSDTSSTRYRYIDSRTRKECEVMLPDGFIRGTLPLAELIDGWLDTPPMKAPSAKLVKAKPRQVRESNGWESLRFGMTSLTEPTTAFLGKRKRPAMVGKFPVRPDRLLTDPERRIFREVVRGRGGIVVFDCSGSMSVSIDDVRDVVKQFAGATVVAYTHRGANLANAWVLARNGRMVSEAQFDELSLNHGNGVDGPILRWAVRQRKTNKDFIIWVSDGHATGTGDVSGHDLVRECASLSSRWNIVGVEDAQEAIQLLADMKRTGKNPSRKYCRYIDAILRTNPHLDYSQGDTK